MIDKPAGQKGDMLDCRDSARRYLMSLKIKGVTECYLEILTNHTKMKPYFYGTSTGFFKNAWGNFEPACQLTVESSSFALPREAIPRALCQKTEL